nr:hypothetical protein [uncultured bacterium]
MFADRRPADRFSLMTRRRFACRLAAAAALTSGGWANHAAADDRMTLGAVNKLRQLAGATFGKKARLLNIGDKVFRDDLLWTRDGGQLQIDMLDGSKLSLGEDAEVRLDDSLRGSAAASFLDILSGAFRFNSGQAEKPASPPKINTPFAILSLRGTEVFGGRLDKTYDIFVFSGEVEVRNEGGAVVLKAGDGTSLVDRKTAPTPPKAWGQPKINRAKAMLPS